MSISGWLVPDAGPRHPAGDGEEEVLPRVDPAERPHPRAGPRTASYLDIYVPFKENRQLIY